MPDPIYFEEVYGAATGASVTSNTQTVTGLTQSASLAITGGTYSENGGAFTSAGGSVITNDTLAVQVTAPSCPFLSTTADLTINGYSYPFTVWSGDGANPNLFSFPAKTNACRSAVTVSDTSPQLCSGWVGTNNITIAGGTSPGYSKNGGAFTSATGSVVLYDTLAVRQTASASFNTTTTTTLTVAGQAKPFQVTTRVSDPVPGSVTFASVNATAGQTNVTSNEVKLDLCANQLHAITASAGTGSYNMCNDSSFPCTAWSGTWNTTTTTPTAGRSVRVRLSAAGTAGTTRTVTLTVNGVPFTFSVSVP
jgi:hypothetical protein